jgi:PAS domain S-box-containing protein
MASRGVVGIRAVGMEQVVDQMPGGVAIIAAESGRIIYTNARAHALLEPVGKRMPEQLSDEFEIFHLDGRPYGREEWPVVRSMASGEHVVDEDYFHLLPDGRRLIVRCSASPLCDERGQIVAGVLVMNDVTQQKRAEDERAYHADLLEQMQDAVLATDDQFVLTAWNKGAEQMFGWTAHEAIGRPVYEVLPQDYSDEQQGEELQQLTQKGRWRGERVWFAKNGRPVPAEGLTVAVRGEQEETIGYLCIMRDVAERKAADAALREAAQRTEDILESITDVFVAVDRDWRYTYVNDRALSRMRNMKGAALAREDVIGQSMWELFPEAVGSETEHRLRTAMTSGDAVGFELHAAWIDQWVETHVYPSPSGLSIYYRDVSARRASEEALRQARQQRADAERRLNDVREAERSRLARDLHDGALQGLTHALAVTGRHASSRDDEVYAILQQVGRQLRAAIYDLRLEQNGERPFADALRDLIELNREMTPACDVVLETDGDLPSGSFGSRATEVLRIVGEALTNACRHAAAEHIVIRITGSESRLSIAVTDDGRGFDPTPERHGQGLRGMHERAALLDGHLDIRSDRTGTTVWLHVALSPA